MTDAKETRIAERFARDTLHHQMKILHDDGLYRHLRFIGPKHTAYWFDLITWPGNLVFRGDGETFAFSRTEDMFQFFRSGLWRDGSINTNPGYWAEKLTSDRDSVMRYDQDLFEQTVKEHVAQCIRDRSAPKGIGKAIRHLFEWGDITHEAGARAELENFEYGTTWKASCVCGASEDFADEYDAILWRSRHIPSGNRQAHRSSTERVEGFRFDDTWEWQFKDYDWWFLWTLYGIVWGIARYDRAKGTRPSTALAIPHAPVTETFASATDPETPEIEDVCQVCWTLWPCLVADLADLPGARSQPINWDAADGAYAEGAPF